MSDIFKPIPDDAKTGTTGTGVSGGKGVSGTSGTNTTGSTPAAGTVYQGSDYGASSGGGEAGKTVLAGVVGGLASAVGYIVYTRLPDDQKDRLHAQVRSLVESRVNELRSRFNL